MKEKQQAYSVGHMFQYRVGGSCGSIKENKKPLQLTLAQADPSPFPKRTRDSTITEDYS